MRLQAFQIAACLQLAADLLGVPGALAVQCRSALPSYPLRLCGSELLFPPVLLGVLRALCGSTASNGPIAPLANFPLNRIIGSGDVLQ